MTTEAQTTHAALAAPAPLAAWRPNDANSGMRHPESCDLMGGATDFAPAPQAAAEPTKPWRVRMICCGKDEGIAEFDTWDAADRFREEYTSGSGVHPNGYSAPAHSSSHKRAAIVEAAPTGAAPADCARRRAWPMEEQPDGAVIPVDPSELAAPAVAQGEGNSLRSVISRIVSTYVDSPMLVDELCFTLSTAPAPAVASDEPSLQDLAAGAFYPQATAWGSSAALAQRQQHQAVEGRASEVGADRAARAWAALSEPLIDEFLEDYEMVGEDEAGRDACHTPSDGERFLIKDAVMGLLQAAWDRASEPTVQASPSAQPQAVPPLTDEPQIEGKAHTTLEGHFRNALAAMGIGATGGEAQE